MLLLLRRDRIVFLNDILLELEELIEREKGVVPGVVVTAVPLSEEEQHTLKTKLEEFCKQNFVFRWKVDPDIIGGIRVKYEDKLIDSTIATFLGDLRTRLKSTRLAS
jgi:F-type H+-transporting ATPase subunit delta